MQKCKSILMATSAHKRKYDAQGRLNSNKGYKYKQIIAPLMSIESKKNRKFVALYMFVIILIAFYIIKSESFINS